MKRSRRPGGELSARSTSSTAGTSPRSRGPPAAAARFGFLPSRWRGGSPEVSHDYLESVHRVTDRGVDAGRAAPAGEGWPWPPERRGAWPPAHGRPLRREGDPGAPSRRTGVRRPWRGRSRHRRQGHPLGNDRGALRAGRPEVRWLPAGARGACGVEARRTGNLAAAVEGGHEIPADGELVV